MFEGCLLIDYTPQQGAGGGPVEDNVTGLLVRSTATKWSRGSVLAVDAGTHLAAVVKIIEEHLPDAVAKSTLASQENGGPQRRLSQNKAGLTNGHNSTIPQAKNASADLVLSTGPFADFELPYSTAKANAAYFVRNLITTYLISHPHLDHISGFVINTAGFQHTSRPKRLAGLPFTIDAFKNHVFNDIIWPNLSDEDGGVGLVSYMRLAEGGNLAIGEGEGRGYIEVCDGLAVKSWSVSHGKCMHNHSKLGNGGSNTQEPFAESGSRRPSQNIATPVGTPTYAHPGFCVTDSSAFFLRDVHTGHEILIFGDVEPDSLSLSPRTNQVWSDAAPKIANGFLKGILIECSYDNSQPDETLFGHLAPRHIIEELQILADKVRNQRDHERGDARNLVDVPSPSLLKRKRASIGSGSVQEDIGRRPLRRGRFQPSPSLGGRRQDEIPSMSPATTSYKNDDAQLALNLDDLWSDLQHEQENNFASHQKPPKHSPDTGRDAMAAPVLTTEIDLIEKESAELPLKGLQVVIIHVKDNLRDGPEAGETILKQLTEGAEGIGLGCTFTISKSGSSIWL